MRNKAATLLLTHHHTPSRHLHRTPSAGSSLPLVAVRAATGSPPPGAVANGRSPGQTLRDAWAELLSRYPWDAFATLTFKNPRRDPFEVAKLFDIWLFRWSCTDAVERGELDMTVTEKLDAYGRVIGQKVKRVGKFWADWSRGRRRPVYALGIETHKTGTLHCHAVLRFPGWEANRHTGWSTWFNPKPVGYDLGRARIEPPKDQDDVRAYCSKYVIKEAEDRGLFRLSETFNAARML